MRTRVSLSVICILLITTSASADFVGVTAVIKDDPDTTALCTEGSGTYVPGPLTVCNLSVAFDIPADRLLAVGNAQLQVFSAKSPDVFFQHVLNPSDISPPCIFVPPFPDLICDSFVTIGVKCGDPSDGSYPDADFDSDAFNEDGHIVGGWFNANPPSGQGDAGNYPELEILILQSAVLQGRHLSGEIDIFWREPIDGQIIAEVDVPIECVAIGGCQDPEDCDDGIPCTEDSCDSGSRCVNIPIDALCDDDVLCTVDVCSADSGCGNTPDNAKCDDGNSCTTDTCDADVGCLNQDVDCDDGNECTDDDCDPDIGCVHLPNNNICDDGDECTFNDHCGEDGCVHGTPIDCSDLDDECNDGVCNPDTGSCEQVPVPDGTRADDGNACTYDDICVGGAPSGTPVQCPKGQVCDPTNGECVEDQDPCECVNGKVTICHIPPGNLANARTITVGCNALERHLAHGDSCGPCEDGDG